MPVNYQSEGFPLNGIFDPCAGCLLVAVGHGGCWLAIAAAVGVIPRFFRLTKVRKIQELLENSDFGK